MLFGIVTKFDKLSSELLTPVLTGEGKTLYALATGLKIIPSKALLNAKVALLNFSEQSLISLGSFFFNNNLKLVYNDVRKFGFIKFDTINFFEDFSKLNELFIAYSLICFMVLSPIDLLGLLTILSNAKSSFS